MTNGLWPCALLCTATGRYAEAATVWAARDVHTRQHGLIGGSPEDARRGRKRWARSGTRWGPPGSGQPNSAARR